MAYEIPQCKNSILSIVMKRKGIWNLTLMKWCYQSSKVEDDKTFGNFLWCEAENCLYVAFVFMIFVSCLLWKRHVFILDGACWMVRCSLWVHILWFDYFPIEALIVIYWVMWLMLEIKRHNWFKDEGRTKLNYAKLGHKIGGFFFVWLLGEKKLHLGK